MKIADKDALWKRVLIFNGIINEDD
jgi:hypothetical protein